MAGHVVSHQRWEAFGQEEQCVEPHASFDPHRLEHVHQVFGADIATGARGEWAASQAAQRGIEVDDAAVECRQRIG